MKRLYKASARAKNAVVTVAVVLAVVVVGVGAALAVYFALNADRTPEAPENGNDVEYMMDGGVKITHIGAYSGAFCEDGSDARVNNVAMVTVENTSEEYIQLMHFTVTGSSGARYEFELTTLFPGEKMVVLEKNRAGYRADSSITSARVTSRAVFAEIPSLHTDVFRLAYDGGTIRVKNLTDREISSGRVCFKQYADGVWFGGITYSMSFSALKPGEEVVLRSTHFVEEKSQMIFVSYAK